MPQKTTYTGGDIPLLRTVRIAEISLNRLILNSGRIILKESKFLMLLGWNEDLGGGISCRSSHPDKGRDCILARECRSTLTVPGKEHPAERRSKLLPG